MRILFFVSMIVLLIAGMMCFIGCSSGWITEDIYIQGIEISISESRPAQVVVTVTASHSNTCISDLEVHQERKGNIISLSGTMRVSYGGRSFSCGDMITDVQEQVSLGEFTVGEYKVIADDLELVFHIEDDESWVIGSPLIESIDTSISESVPAQVIVNVEGYFCEAGIPFLETHQKQERDTIYVQMTSKVPSRISCPLVIHSGALTDSLARGLVKHQEQVPIGEFTTGHYRVIVNDIIDKRFLIE